MSKVTLTIQFESESDAAAFFARVAPQVAETSAPIPIKVPVTAANPAKPKVTPKAAAPATVLAAPPVHAPVTPVAPAPKQEPVAAAPEPIPMPATVPLQSPAPKALASVDAPTIDAVRVALRSVFNKPGGKGAQDATALLTKYKATSVSHIKVEDYAAFIKDCA